VHHVGPHVALHVSENMPMLTNVHTRDTCGSTFQRYICDLTLPMKGFPKAKAVFYVRYKKSRVYELQSRDFLDGSLYCFDTVDRQATDRSQWLSG